MVKRRPLTDALAYPEVKAKQPLKKSPAKNAAPPFSKVIISAAAVIVGVAAGVLLNRYLKIF
jgi:hypothetical protein